jgi:hypothetical protein
VGAGATTATSIITPSVDTATQVTMAIGGTNATTINVGRTGQTTAVLGNSTVAGTLGVTGLFTAGNVSFTRIANGSTTITNAGINTSNGSFTNVSVSTINGQIYGTATANISTNMSFINLSVTGNFSMPSTALMTVSNASFINVSSITGIFSTSIYSAGFYSTSDYKLKENITYITNKYDIENLKPCSFNFINSSTKKIGFIAQDIEKIIPEAVTSIGDTMNIDYSALVSVCVDSMKQMIKKLEVSEKRIEILEKRIEILESK